MKAKYEEILYLEMPKSKHPRMSLSARAGQFSAFNALSGHEEAIENTAHKHDENMDYTYVEGTFEE